MTSLIYKSYLIDRSDFSHTKHPNSTVSYICIYHHNKDNIKLFLFRVHRASIQYTTHIFTAGNNFYREQHKLYKQMSRHALCKIRDPLICFGKFFPGKEIFIVSLLIRIFLSPCFCFYLLNSNFSENQQINSDSISHTRRFHPIIKPSKLYFCTIQRFTVFSFKISSNDSIHTFITINFSKK